MSRKLLYSSLDLSKDQLCWNTMALMCGLLHKKCKWLQRLCTSCMTHLTTRFRRQSWPNGHSLTLWKEGNFKFTWIMPFDVDYPFVTFQCWEQKAAQSSIYALSWQNNLPKCPPATKLDNWLCRNLLNVLWSCIMCIVAEWQTVFHVVESTQNVYQPLS